MIDLNLVAAMDLCRLAAPLLFAQAGSTVINVSSIYGLVGRGPDGRVQRVQGRAGELHPSPGGAVGRARVRVNALAPGFFPTELTGG